MENGFLCCSYGLREGGGGGGAETRGALSSGFRFEEGATRGRSLQGGREERKQRVGDGRRRALPVLHPFSTVPPF